MRVTIRAEPVYWIEFSPEQLRTLMMYSANHYDSVCKSACKTGGFLYGWYNSALFYEQAPSLHGDDPHLCRATGREVDILCKILEIGDNLSGFYLVKDVAGALRNAVGTAEEMLSLIKIVLKDETLSGVCVYLQQRGG